MEKKLTLTIEQARRLYENSDLEWQQTILETYSLEELFPPYIPRTWKEIVETYTDIYKINDAGEIDKDKLYSVKADDQLLYDFTLLPTEKSARKIIALCQIAMIAEYYNKTYPENEARCYRPYILRSNVNSVEITSETTQIHFPFPFCRALDLKEAIKHNEQIFLDALL